MSAEKIKQLNNSLNKYTKQNNIDLKKGNGTEIILMRFYGKNKKKIKKVTKKSLFLELANINKETGKSKWISTEQFTGKYSCLQTTNGGDWCRLDTFTPAIDYILVTVKKMVI